jgi:hypothetical protein
MFYEIYAATVAAAVAANVYDIYMTEKGVKAGVAIEAFDWLVGTKPTVLALALRDLGIVAVASTPALVLYTLGSVPAAYGCLAGPAVAAIKHILGGRSWGEIDEEIRKVRPCRYGY